MSLKIRQTTGQSAQYSLDTFYRTSQGRRLAKHLSHYTKKVSKSKRVICLGFLPECADTNSSLSTTQFLLHQPLERAEISPKIKRFSLSREGTIPLKESSMFDTAIITHGLEYMSVPQYFLREVSRVLKPGGTFLLLNADTTLLPLKEAPPPIYRPALFNMLTEAELVSLKTQGLIFPQLRPTPLQGIALIEKILGFLLPDSGLFTLWWGHKKTYQKSTLNVPKKFIARPCRY